MRASLTGTLVLGLVTIAVKAFQTTHAQDLHLTTLHRKCQAPVKITHVCKMCEAPVPKNDAVKGIETPNGWVTWEENELADLEPATPEGRPIRGEQCIPLAHVNPLWYDQAYFLVPADAEGMRPYALIKRVLRDESKAVVVTYTTRGHLYLGIVEANEEGLLLRRLFYADEMLSLKDYHSGVAPIDLSPKEIALAKRLFKLMTRPFKHDNYQDLGHLRFLEVLHAKEKKLPIPPQAIPKPVPQQAGSLVDALNRSVTNRKIFPQQKRAASK